VNSFIISSLLLLAFFINFSEYFWIECINKHHYIFVNVSLIILALIFALRIILSAISFNNKNKINLNVMKTNVNKLSTLEAYTLLEYAGLAPFEPDYGFLIPLFAQLNSKSYISIFKGKIEVNTIVLKSKELEPYERKAIKILSSNEPLSIFTKSMPVEKSLIRKGFMKPRFSLFGFNFYPKLTFAGKRQIVKLERKTDFIETFSSADPYYYSFPHLIPKDDRIYEQYDLFYKSYKKYTEDLTFSGNSSILIDSE
jgi:hypothetical protein